MILVTVSRIEANRDESKGTAHARSSEEFSFSDFHWRHAAGLLALRCSPLLLDGTSTCAECVCVLVDRLKV